MDWRKYNLVEYRKGHYRLERQNWGFWDWCILLFAVALLSKVFHWLVLAGIAAGLVAIVMAVALALVSIRGLGK